MCNLGRCRDLGGKRFGGGDIKHRSDRSFELKGLCGNSLRQDLNKYTFRATGSYAGTTNAVLKYATADGKWHNIPIRFTTDKKLNVTGKQTGKEYITNTRRG